MAPACGQGDFAAAGGGGVAGADLAGGGWADAEREEGLPPIKARAIAPVSTRSAAKAKSGLSNSCWRG
jgi:hypothetical protein